MKTRSYVPISGSALRMFLAFLDQSLSPSGSLVHSTIIVSNFFRTEVELGEASSPTRFPNGMRSGLASAAERVGAPTTTW